MSQSKLTEVAPFQLESELRHDMSRATWEAQVSSGILRRGSSIAVYAQHASLDSDCLPQVEKELQEERAKFSSFHARAVPKAVLSRYSMLPLPQQCFAWPGLPAWLALTRAGAPAGTGSSRRAGPRGRSRRWSRSSCT